MEEGDEEAGLASRKKKGKVGGYMSGPLRSTKHNVLFRFYHVFLYLPLQEVTSFMIMHSQPLDNIIISQLLKHFIYLKWLWVRCCILIVFSQTLPSILGDDRFKVMFENPEYQVDEQSEEFRLLNPIISKVGQKRNKKLHLLATQQVRLIPQFVSDTMAAIVILKQLIEWLNVCFQAAEDEEEAEGRGSSEEESSDDDKSWVEEVREQRRLLRQEDRDRWRQERKEADRRTVLLENGQQESDAAEKKNRNQPQFYQIKTGEEFRSFNYVYCKQKLQKYVCEDVLTGLSYYLANLCGTF